MKYGNGKFQSYISAPKKNTSTIILGLYRFGKFCQFSNDTTLQDTKPMLNLTSCEYWKWKVPYSYNSTPKKNTPSKILAFLDLASLQIIKRYNASRYQTYDQSDWWSMENRKFQTLHLYAEKEHIYYNFRPLQVWQFLPICKWYNSTKYQTYA